MKIVKSLYYHFLNIIKPITLRLDYFQYQRRHSELREKIFGKEKIKVVFFPISIGMWKNDLLFNLFQNHPRFDPYVISFFVPGDNLDYQKRNQQEMKCYFESKRFPYYDMYDFEKKKWFDIELFRPDIVFYTQAVGVGYKRYNIKALWKNCLFYYIPYCLGMENQTKGYNTLLDNICEKFFAPSEFHKKYYASFFLNKGRNVVVSGYPSFDYLVGKQPSSSAVWKCRDHRKRIIWAPHHSITNNDLFHYSNFLEIADEMVKLAKRYKELVEFVFKPHPRLRPKLERMKDWGYERTASYYQMWKDMPNTNIADGDYFDLFLSSDALIHDCSTFMAEYLLTGKPALFVLKRDGVLNLNEYAQKCFDHHYVGSSIEDIDHFISTIIIDGNDYKKYERKSFINSSLLPISCKSVAQNIFEEIINSLK